MSRRGLTEIDTLKEKERMYRVLRKRIKKLIQEEKETGVMKPELRESISCANALLREIRIDSRGFEESSIEMKERIFGDWIRKKKEEESEKEESED